MEPLERLLNLVGLLLETSRPLTFEQIREAMPEAYGGENVDSAKRKFERDKDDLRNYDIPLEMQDVDAWGTEQGYAIPKERYYLPEISFTPEEMAALFVAAQAGGGDPSAEQAVRKLLYGAEGGVLAGLSGGALALDGDAGRRRLLAAADAASRQRRVRFGYRTSAGRSGERLVDAFAMVCRGGHWYLVGHDRERDAIRAFRLSRLTTDPRDEGDGVAPPEGFHAAEHVQAGPWGVGEPRERAVIAFSPEVAWWATTGLNGAEPSPPREDGWTEVAVPLTDVAALAGWVLSFGPDAEAIAPESLRTTVVARLERAADA
jgi:proteasome accessory factor B